MKDLYIVSNESRDKTFCNLNITAIALVFAV